MNSLTWLTAYHVELCNDLEDLTPEEKELELEPVNVQEIYLLARTGQLDRAKELAASFSAKRWDLFLPSFWPMLILRFSVEDEAIKVIATINRIAVDAQAEDYNPYLALKAYTEATKNAVSLAARPFSFQLKILKLDEAILDLDAGKSNACQSKATEYHNLYPADKSINVVNAAARTANMTGREVVKKIERMFEANPVDIGLALTLIQLRMSTGNITGSISTLELLFSKLEPDKRYQPGLVGLLVALYEHQGRKQHVRKVLSDASEWWRQSSQPVCQPPTSNRLILILSPEHSCSSCRRQVQA